MVAGPESLNDLLLGGEVSEGTSESNENFSERIKATQKQIAGVRREEKKEKDFDKKLAQIITNVSPFVLDFVIFLINHEIPSLSILAILSVVNEDSKKICFLEFDKFIEQRADFSAVKFEDPDVEERISYWWTFILAAEGVSKTTQLKSFCKNDKFVAEFSKNLADLLVVFLRERNVEEFDRGMLKKALTKYEEMVFEGL